MFVEIIINIILILINMVDSSQIHGAIVGKLLN